MHSLLLGNRKEGQSQSCTIGLEGSDNMENRKQVVLTSELRDRKEDTLRLALPGRTCAQSGQLGLRGHSGTGGTKGLMP